MKSPLKAKTNDSLKAKDKGKGKEVERKKPASQLKAGWALVPLALATPSSASDKKNGRKRSLSPVKKNTTPLKSAPPRSKKLKPNAPAAIEILSDSEDDEIQEISSFPVASTSRVKLEASVKVKTELRITSVVPPSRASSTSSLATTRQVPVIVNDADEEDGNVFDLEEDESFLDPPRVRDDYSAFEDDILADAGDDEVWEDSDRVTMGLPRGQSMDFEEGDESQMLEDNDLNSDEDILELMDRGDSTEPVRAGKKRRISEVSMQTPDSKSLLRPLSALRRSISPAAGGGPLDPSRPNAFTALMTGNNVDKKWADAAETEKAAARRGFMRPAPFYKILEGMNIAVDAFKYGKIPGVEAYFLSHAHSDHYTNLSSSWSHGPIYCSVGTANLIKYKLGVKDEWVHPLPFDETFEIAGTRVTTIDANHCPGSSIFLFEGPHTSPTSSYHKSPKNIFRYLHCGDFRASPAHLLHPALKDKKIDICYLDTTYLNPRYCFPAQEQVINACAELVKCRIGGDRDALMKGSGGGAQLVRQGEMMKGWLSKAKKEEMEEAADALIAAGGNASTSLVPIVKNEKPRERLLVMVGTYSIGKERIVKAIARAINAKIYCDKRKREIFECQDDPELMSMVTDDPIEGQVHVTWLGQIKVDELSDYLDKFKPHFTNIIGLRPTGWTFKPEGTLATSLKQPSVIQMLSKELQRNYNPSWMTPTKDSTRTVEAYGVPYSEHSSFAELTCFAVSMECLRIIPTVNVGSKLSRQKMAVWIDKWAAERKRRKAAGEPLMVPHRSMQYW